MATSKKITKAPIKQPAKPVETIPAPVVKTARYLNKNIKISPRKLRLMAGRIKSLAPSIALTQLKFTNTKAAKILVKSVQNVIADATNNFGLDPDTLKFDSIRVDEGLKIKRMDKSHSSRYARGLIQKRHSRLEIIISGQTKIKS